MANDLVVMHNDIVTSAYNLSVNEQRLIYCALKQIPKSEPIDPKTPFYISREDFIELGANPDNVARDIRQATKDLMKKTLYVKTNTGILEFHWLSEVLRYDKNAEQKLREKYPDPKDHKEYMNSLRLYNLLDALPMSRTDDVVARVVFHERVVPLLSDLKASFTQFLLNDVADFSSIYSYRIYQLMMRYKSTGYVKIGLDDLRFMLMLMDKYPLTADLKRWVIDTAVEEISKQSPYEVKQKLIKKGRKYTHLELKFKPKEKPKEIRDPHTIDWINGVTDDEIKGMSPAQASKYAGLLHKEQGIVGNWSDCDTYAKAKTKLTRQLQQPEYVRKYMSYLLNCDDPFDPKTVGFK